MPGLLSWPSAAQTTQQDIFPLTGILALCPSTVMGSASCSNLHIIPWAGNCTITCYSVSGLWVGSWDITHCTPGCGCTVSTKAPAHAGLTLIPLLLHQDLPSPHCGWPPCELRSSMVWNLREHFQLTYSSAGPGSPCNCRSDSVSTKK